MCVAVKTTTGVGGKNTLNFGWKSTQLFCLLFETYARQRTFCTPIPDSDKGAPSINIVVHTHRGDKSVSAKGGER